MSRTGAALRYPQFRRLWIGTFFAYTAQWLQQTTLGWVAYQLTGSATMIGAILGARAIPLLLVPPIAGVAADRFDRLRLLIGSQILFTIASALVGVAIALDALRVWHLFVFIIVWGTAHSIDRTMRQSMILDLVPRTVAIDAIALNGIVYGVTRIVAPAIAGYTIAWFSAAGNFFMQAVGYALFGLTVLGLKLPPRIAAKDAVSPWRSLAEGFAYAANDPTTRIILVATAVPFFLLVPTWSTLMPLYAQDEFRVGPEGLGWMLTAIGGGAILGGLAGPMLSRFDRLGWIQMAALAGYAFVLIMLGVSPSMMFALPFIAIAGAAEIINLTVGQTLLQVSSPDAMRGRLMGLMQMNPAIMSIGSVISGALADIAGPRGASFIAAIAAILAGLILIVMSARLRGLRLSHYTSAAKLHPRH